MALENRRSINTLLGFHPPPRHRPIFGKDIRSEAKNVRGMLGYMPENDSFIAGMTGVHFVRLMAELSGLPPEQAMERAHEALLGGSGRSPLPQPGHLLAGHETDGQAGASHRARSQMLFLDRPTNGLDPPARARMIRLIQEIRDRGDLRLILSSHLLRMWTSAAMKSSS